MIESPLTQTFKQQSESFKNLKEAVKESSEGLSSANSKTNSKKIDRLKSKINKNKEPSSFKNIGELSLEENRLTNLDSKKWSFWVFKNKAFQKVC